MPKEHVGCWTAISVRFNHEQNMELASVLAADAIDAVINECVAGQAFPVGVLSVAVGPCHALTELFEKVSAGTAVNPKTIAGSDQVRATFAAEPHRFAAFAFAHVHPDPDAGVPL